MIFCALSTFALRQVMGDGAENVVGALGGHFTDQTRLLLDALHKSNERAWKALEIALAGEGFWNKLDAAEDKALRQQVRGLLDAMPLPLLTGRSEFRRLCLKELQDARKKGLLLSGTAEELAKSARAVAGGDPLAVLDRERAALRDIGQGLEKAGFKNLAWLVNQEVQPGQAMLVQAVRYFFRRAIETKPELARGLQFTRMEDLTEAQASGFRQLEEAFKTHGQRLDRALDDLMAVAAQTRDAVLDIKEEQRRHGDQLGDIYRLLQQVMEQTQMQQRREVRPGDSRSLRGPGERQRVRELVDRYESLPEQERRQRPALLNAVGMLRVAAGDCQEAQRDFDRVADLVGDAPQARAQARHNAYQAALERRDFPDALAALRESAALDPETYAPFPFGDYVPQRILGAGGFGVAFLCQHATLKRPLVVKTLRLDGLDRDVDDVFREAQVLNDLDHPAIIRLRDCRFADAARKRPYLVMDYFESVSLADHVAKHGPLAPDEMLTVARAVAEALLAAHAQGILHRDVKPDNLLVRPPLPSPPKRGRGVGGEGGGWRVKLIDFGLAVKEEMEQATARTPGMQSPAPHEYGFAGTIDYASPEQMGRLPGVSIGTYSDVYGFGKTCYFALLGTPEPDDGEKETLDEAWRKLLSQCTARKIESRLHDFGVVLERLREVEEALAGRPRPRPAPAVVPKPRPNPVAPPPAPLPPREIARTPPPAAKKPMPEVIPPRYIETPPAPPAPARPGPILSDLWTGSLSPASDSSEADTTGTDVTDDVPAAPPETGRRKPGQRGPLGSLFEQPSAASPGPEEANERPVPDEEAVPPKKDNRKPLGGAFLDDS